MSSANGRGRPPQRGLFVEGVWQCDCNPRIPAVHFEVKKEGPNKGKWFRSCQKQQNDKTRCQFFLWDVDACRREAAALASNSRTETRLNPTTPSKRRSSPPPPYTVEAGPSKSSRKRRRIASRSPNDEFGVEQANNSFNDELVRVLTAVETPNKAIKTSSFTTPSARRKLPWQTDKPANKIVGLGTPQSDRRARSDPFNTTLTAPSGVVTPSSANRHDNNIHQNATSPSCFDTPTPNRFKDVGGDDLVRDVLGSLQAAGIQLDVSKMNDLKSLLSKHTNSAEGYRRGRDVLRTTVKAKDAKITELTYRVSTLEAELEAEKATVEHLRWEAQTIPQSDP